MDVPFTLVVPTVYGQMLVNRFDINQTNALIKTGRSLDHGDIVLLGNILRKMGTDLVVVDAGANFGAFSLGLVRAVGPRGKVHAFEAQRVLFNMLAGSIALNSLLNVYCYHVALGDHEGVVEIPQFDYFSPLNFGSIEFTGEQRERLTQERGHDPARADYVPLAPLDRFKFERLDLLKIDVEGMEKQVLEGAAETIGRCQPVIFAECLKSNRAELRGLLARWEYTVYESAMNFLCIPAKLRTTIVPTVVNGQGAGRGEGAAR
jgi:FkbM family methyltransferase